MNLFELSAKISVDDSAFKKSMENAQKVSKNVATAIKQLQSPLDKAKSGFNAIAHPVETAKANIEKLKNATEAIRHPIETFKNKVADASTALETKRNKLSTLAAGYDSAKKKVADITKEFNKSAKESGTSSQKTQELAKRLNEAEKEAEEAKKELDDYSASVSKAGKNSDSASKGVGNFASKLGKGIATAGKIGVAAVGAAAAGITALTKAAVDNYAEYEQLIGGVETLYGAKYKTIEEYIEGTGAAAEYAEQTFAEYQKRQQAVLDNAANAYKTAGMSANEYMNTVNGFAASLTSSLGEYEWQAASYADMIVSDMADNANKMGTNMEMIQNAYSGFAKQNYTMLDNLKLGYGGTKTEMERLLRDAERMAGYIEGSLDIESFADVADAIHIVQEEMGITGTTAKEAASTIQGSVGMMKSSWTNLVTGLADENSNLGALVENVISSAFTVVDNVLPRIEQALPSVATAITTAIPELITKISEVIDTALPTIIESAVSIIETLIQAISDNKDMLASSAITIITQLANGILNMLPEIIKLGLDLIVSLANGIAESLPELIPTIIDVVLQIVETLTKPETLMNLLDAAIVLIENLAYGLMDAIPQLVQAALLIIEKLVAFLLDPANLAKLLKMAFDIIVGIGTGLINAIPELLKSVTRIITGIIALFKDADWGKIGKDLVDGFKRGISNAWSSLKTWFKNLFGDLIGIAKKILGIASPSKVFKKIGGFTAEGFGAGFEDEFAHVKNDMEDALNFDDASVGINASIRKVGAGTAGGAFGGTSIGNININIDGAKYTDEQSLASAIALEIQNMTDRRAAVYA